MLTQARSEDDNSFILTAVLQEWITKIDGKTKQETKREIIGEKIMHGRVKWIKNTLLSRKKI